jgi:phosphoserine phosphatase
VPMLSVVGRPCAVNPDFRLRALAKTHRWPVLDLDKAA